MSGIWIQTIKPVFGEVCPGGIVALNKCHFPLAVPILQLFFSLYGAINIRGAFKEDQFIDIIFFTKT